MGIPSSIKIGAYIPSPGDQLAVFTADGSICAGMEVWTGSNIAITVWGDDSQTAERDGMLSGEEMVFRFWDQSTSTEFFVGAAGFSLGDGLYQTDTLHIVSSLVP